MSGFLKTWQSTWARAPQKRDSWGPDRNWHRSEAARHLNAGNPADAERHLMLAVREADERGIAAAQRAELRLELAALQRRLAAPPNGDKAEAKAGAKADARPLDLAKLRDAENTLREAIIISTQASDSKLYLSSLDALAEVSYLAEDYPALERVAADAIRLGTSIPNEDPRRMEDRLQRLAMAQDKNGRFPDALKTFDRAIAFREKHYGATHLETGNLLTEVGRICRSRGVHDQAQAYLTRALRIHEAQCGADSMEALGDVRELAGTLEDIGDLAGATAQYERILGLQAGSKNLEEVASMQYSLACMAIGWGGYSRARELLVECIEALQPTGGSRLAVAYESLAHVEEQEGRVPFALDQLAKATEIWEQCDPPRLEDLARNLELRAELSEQLRMHIDANHLRKRARHIAAAAEDQATAAETPAI